MLHTVKWTSKMKAIIKSQHKTGNAKLGPGLRPGLDGRRSEILRVELGLWSPNQASCWGTRRAGVGKGPEASNRPALHAAGEVPEGTWRSRAG